MSDSLAATRKTAMANPVRGALAAERLCLLIALSFVVVYTLAPFEFSFSQADLVSRAKAVLLSTSSGGILKLTGHVVVFFVLGVLFVAAHEPSLEGIGFGRFVLGAAMFCFGLESVQFLAESRHARTADLLCNFLGVVLGVKASMRWRRLRALRMAMQTWFDHHRVRFQGVLFMVTVITWCSVASWPALGVLKMNWNGDYHLVMANESDRSRPWLGEIGYVGIYDRALTAEQVLAKAEGRRQKAKTSAPGLQPLALPAPLAGYDFARGRAQEILPEGMLRSGDLAIQIPESCEWIGGGGILIKESALLMTQESARRLTSAISSSGAFSVEALVRPLAEAQTGPARIVSLSDGIWNRNFTLGQDGTDWIFRVRNGVNGSNGIEHALQVKAALQTSLQHLVAVYDHGVSSLFRDGRLLVPTIDLREPFIYLRLGPGAAGRAVGALLLTMTLALPAYSLSAFVCRGVGRHLLAVVVTFGAGSLPYAVACLMVGGAWRVDLFLWVAGALLIIYPLGLFYVCRTDVGKLRCTAT